MFPARSVAVGLPALLLALGMWGAAQAGDWNTGVGGNSARDSLSCEIGPDGPEILWQGSLPAIVAQQAAIDGDIVVMARITSFTIPTGTTLVAHDLFTGEMLWDTQLPFDFADSWRSRISAIRDGVVYATRAGNTNLDYLYALDSLDGSIVWQSDDLVDEGTTESLAFSADGDIIAGNFSSILRIDQTDGSTVWQTPRSCPTSSGCQVAVFDERAYLWEAGPAGPVISVFDVVGGSFLYSSPAVGGGFIQQVGPFVGPDGTVYAPRSVNNPALDFLVAYEDTGTAFEEKWSVPIGFVPFASFGIGPDGTVYAYQTSTGPDEITLIRIDPDTGAIIDSSLPMPSDFPAQPRIAIDDDGKVFFTNGGFADGALYSLNADLSLRWMETVPNVNVGGPAIGTGGVLVVCGVGTDVRAYLSLPPIPIFLRGDFDGDGSFNGLSDGVASLTFGFQGGAPPLCNEASDADGNGTFNPLVDSIYSLAHQFQGGPGPPPPYPACGFDPDPGSSLGCAPNGCL